MQDEITLSKETTYSRNPISHGVLSARSLMRVRGFGDFLSLLFMAFLALLAEFIKLKSENDELHKRIKVLETDNQNLYEQAYQGSDTSSIPPGKDWKNRIAKGSADVTDTNDPKTNINTREEPISITSYLKNRNGNKKHPGGQPHHPSAFMRISDVQNRAPVFHYPDCCSLCTDFSRCIEEGRLRQYSTSHGYDLEIIRVHREHRLFEVADCLRGGLKVREDFPEVIGTQYYETNIQLHVITWHHLFHGSYDRIDLAAKELLGLSLSAGTANAIVQRVGAKLLNSGFIDAIRFYILLYEKVLGVDETSARVAGRNAWVHTAVTDSVTLLTAHWHRGYKGAIYSGVLQFYTYVLISDCWASYFNEKLNLKHAICNGHILRELVAAAYFREQGWAIDMFDLLLEIFAVKEDAIAHGDKSLQQNYIDTVRVRYRQIIKDGYAGISGEKKGKTFSLLERLNKLEDAALAFAINFNVNFTNNTSEISLRNFKVAMRVAGQFKTMSGLGDYCIIQSFMDTSRKQNRNPFDMLRIVLAGGDIIKAVFGDQKAAELKKLITLTDIVSGGDSYAIIASLAGFEPYELTDELRAAVSYGRYKTYDHPPPEKKNVSVIKDKMKEARKIEELKKWSRARQNNKKSVMLAITADN